MEHHGTVPRAVLSYARARALPGKRKKPLNLRSNLPKVQVLRSLRFLRVAFLPRKAEYNDDVDILKVELPTSYIVKYNHKLLYAFF